MSHHKSHSKPRLVLVLGDGAIRGGFVAGVIGRLVQSVPELLPSIDVVYGASASAGNALYLTNFKEKHPGERMWTELLCDPLFINRNSLYDRDPIYNIEYLVEQIFRQRTPLPEEDGGIPVTTGVILPTIEVGTNKVHYFANAKARSLIRGVGANTLEPMEGHDIYRLIGAASAAPFVFDMAFEIGNRRLIDGATLAPSIDGIEFIDEDPSVIYIFCRKPPTILSFADYILSTFAFITFIFPFRSRRLPIRHYLQYAAKPFIISGSFKRAFAKQKYGKAVVIYPTRDLGDMRDNSSYTLKENYLHGEEVADKLAGRVKDLIKLI